jgi:hypothetical protein
LGDAASGTFLPTFLSVNSSDLLSWAPLNSTYTAQNISGASLLVDDVLALANTTLANVSLTELRLDLEVEHFFRIAVSFPRRQTGSDGNFERGKTK